MTEPKLISPMLDDFEIGGPISDHDGVRCYPAMRKNSEERYIVKIISVPASQTKLDALLLTGAYPTKEAALGYFREIADEIADEKKVLDDLAQLEGFVPYTDIQIVPKDDETGYDVYLLSEYRMTLERKIAKGPLTQLAAVNLGLDLCTALAVCRRSGYMCVDLKPANIILAGENEYRIGDLGFVKLNSLQYASLPDKYRSKYTAPEAEDAFSSLNDTMDIYAAGLILYQIFNAGNLPFETDVAPAEKFDAPVYADAEMAEIILKACDPVPSERWQDPMQMGQAIVSYMQKNGVNDTPLSAELCGVQDALQEDIEDPEVTEDVTVDTEITEEVAANADISEDVTENADIEPEHEAVLLDDAESELLNPTETESDHTAETDAVVVDESEEANEADEASADEEPILINDPEFEVAQEEIIEEVSNDDVSDLVTTENSEPVSTETSEDLDSDVSENDAITLDEIVADFSDHEDVAVDYNDISEEVSDMLSQIDELTSHQIPEPAVAPEPIEIKLPETQLDVEPTEDDSQVDSEDTDASSATEDTQDELSTSVTDPLPTEEVPYVPKKKRTGLKLCIALLIIIGLAVGGYFFYQEYYLQPIHTLTLEGVEDRLQVQLTADIDETLLRVVCADSHGNKIPAPVVGGTAVFSGLKPDTAYTVNVEVDGFHKLTGVTSKVYSTPTQTKIAQISIVTGAESGSVILSFAVEGPDSDQWNVIYFADGEAERVTTFPSHMVTLTGLTVGKEYTFRLEPVNEIYLNGEAKTTYTAKDVVYAENLHVVSCANGELTVQWDQPDGLDVSSWSVHCYNEAGYDATVLTEDTSVVFENIDDASGYTIDVTAADMSVNRRVVVSPNSVTVTQFLIDNSRSDNLLLNWAANCEIPAQGWTLNYSVDGINATEAIKTNMNAAFVPVVPNGNYIFTLLDGAGNAVLGGPFTHAQADAADFDSFSVTKSDLTARLCKTPSASSWSYKDLKDDDYVNSFAAGQKMSAVIALSGNVERSDSEVLITYVIRDEDSNLVSFSHDTQAWRAMWYENYCELDISGIPSNVGTYQLSIYFNGQSVGTQKFEITA